MSLGNWKFFRAPVYITLKGLEKIQALLQVPPLGLGKYFKMLHICLFWIGNNYWCNFEKVMTKGSERETHVSRVLTSLLVRRGERERERETRIDF